MRPDHAYDVIPVHVFCRFYREHNCMELKIRKLRKHGVTLSSMTPMTGEDLSSQRIRHFFWTEMVHPERFEPPTSAFGGQ